MTARNCFTGAAVLGKQLDQLAARAQFELAVHAAEMELDGLGTEDEPRGDLFVRQSFRRSERDLKLLWREPIPCGRVAPP